MNEAYLSSALQTVISPVVLISGVGMLVLSMTNRLSHATDRLRDLADEWHRPGGNARHRITPQVRVFRLRLRLLVVAISFALGSVLLTALLIITLLASYLFDANLRVLIVSFFALSLVSLVVSLGLFLRDMSLALGALDEELRDIT